MLSTVGIVGFMYVYVFMYSMYLMYAIIVDKLTKQIPNNWGVWQYINK